MKIDCQFSFLPFLETQQVRSHSRFHAVHKTPGPQLTILQKITVIAAAALVLLGLALFVVGKPLVGAVMVVAAFGIGYYFYACLIFSPGPLPPH